MRRRMSAQRMRLYNRGVLSPGKQADFIFLDDLDAFTIHSVYKEGTNITNLPEDLFTFNLDYIFNTIKRRPIKQDDLKLPISNLEGDEVKIRIMHREISNTFTEEMVIPVKTREGVLQWEDAGLTMIAVIERYGHRNR